MIAYIIEIQKSKFATFNSVNLTNLSLIAESDSLNIFIQNRVINSLIITMIKTHWAPNLMAQINVNYLIKNSSEYI